MSCLGWCDLPTPRLEKLRAESGLAHRDDLMTMMDCFGVDEGRKPWQRDNQIMNTEIIVNTARATLAGTISFPDVVGQLLNAGVEYYHVDYVGLRKTFYGAAGDTVVTPIDYEGLPPVAAEFSIDALRANILDSQQRGQAYRDFTRRAMEAGVQGYFAFLRGKRVTYWGRTGDQHTEWFPGAAPLPND